MSEKFLSKIETESSEEMRRSIRKAVAMTQISHIYDEIQERMCLGARLTGRRRTSETPDMRSICYDGVTTFRHMKMIPYRHIILENAGSRGFYAVGEWDVFYVESRTRGSSIKVLKP